MKELDYKAGSGQQGGEKEPGGVRAEAGQQGTGEGFYQAAADLMAAKATKMALEQPEHDEGMDDVLD